MAMKEPKDSYACPNCGYVLPKKDVVISGYDSQSSLRHIHCPRCGKRGESNLKLNSLVHGKKINLNWINYEAV